MKSYIALGLTALARTAELTGNSGLMSWFSGHNGAAVIAGAFLLENEAMNKQSRALITTQLDNIIASNESYFVPFAKTETVALASLLELIENNCSKLSNSGHGVIYGTLALRALSVFPDMATVPMLQGLCDILEVTQVDDRARYFGCDDYSEYETRLVTTDLLSTVQRAYRMSCGDLYEDQEVDGKHYFFAGEKIHAITHAQALHNLSTLGYPVLANKGLRSLNKQLELNEQCPNGAASDKELSLNIFDGSFWGQRFKDPHSLKLVYSAVELNRYFGDDVIPVENLSRHFALLH